MFDEERSGGVQLFKLHGSLNWFGNDPNVREDARPPCPLRDDTLGGAKLQLLLGPAPKEQTDDPYAWLLHRFHETLQHVGFCVVIGFSWRDPHVEERIRHERNLGLDVIEVAYPVASRTYERRTAPAGCFARGAFKPVECKASDALRYPARLGRLLRDLRPLLRRQRLGSRLPALRPSELPQRDRVRVLRRVLGLVAWNRADGPLYYVEGRFVDVLRTLVLASAPWDDRMMPQATQ